MLHCIKSDCFKFQRHHHHHHHLHSHQHQRTGVVESEVTNRRVSRAPAVRSNCLLVTSWTPLIMYGPPAVDVADSLPRRRPPSRRNEWISRVVNQRPVYRRVCLCLGSRVIVFAPRCCQGRPSTQTTDGHQLQLHRRRSSVKFGVTISGHFYLILSDFRRISAF